jgi:hypothetical protein
MKNKKKKPKNIDTLIKVEWDIIQDLRKMLRDPQTSAAENIRASNALAYHICVMNKLLVQKNKDFKFDEEDLGYFITSI